MGRDLRTPSSLAIASSSASSLELDIMSNIYIPLYIEIDEKFILIA
jgi:hypothetical protein